MARPTGLLVRSKAGDGSDRGRSEEGRGKAFWPQPSVKPSDEDLRWVPPWLSQVRTRLKRRISSLPSEMSILIEASRWRSATVLSKLKATSQKQSQVPISRSLVIEVWDLPKVSYLPANGWLGLSLSSGKTTLLTADFYTNCPGCSFVHAFLIRSMVSVFGGYPWTNAFDITGDLGMRFEQGSMARCSALSCYICCLDDKIFNLSLFSGSVYTVLHWVDICLFSVILNTVHSWLQCVPVQWVWRYCSSLGWNCNSFSCCHTNCALCASVMIDLLEHVSRKIVRNHFYRWVLIEADLVTMETAKASLDGLALCVGYLDLLLSGWPSGPLVLWMFSLIIIYVCATLWNLYWPMYLDSVFVCFKFNMCS